MGNSTLSPLALAQPEEVSTLDLLTPKLGIGYAWLLYKLGYKTVADVKKLTTKDIRAIPGFGVARANIVIQALDDLRNQSYQNENIIYVNFRQMELFSAGIK